MQRIENIKKMYMQGMKIKDIAEKLKLSLSTISITVSKLIKFNEIPSRTRIYTEQELSYIALLYNKGVKNNDIAKEIGITPHNINSILRSLKKQNKLNNKKAKYKKGVHFSKQINNNIIKEKFTVVKIPEDVQPTKILTPSYCIIEVNNIRIIVLTKKIDQFKGHEMGVISLKDRGVLSIDIGNYK